MERVLSVRKDPMLRLLEIGPGDKVTWDERSLTIEDHPYWFHLDVRPLDHIEFVQDATDLSNFPDNSIGLIEAMSVVEHFNRHKVKAVLAEWFRVLCPGGVFYPTVPGIKGPARRILADEIDWERAQDIFGGQTYPFDVHYTCWTEEWMYKILKDIGFVDIGVTRPHGKRIMVGLGGKVWESGEDGFQMGARKPK